MQKVFNAVASVFMFIILSILFAGWWTIIRIEQRWNQQIQAIENAVAKVTKYLPFREQNEAWTVEEIEEWKRLFGHAPPVDMIIPQKDKN